MAKVKYLEGDWFAVPLLDGGFGVGVIARANPKAALLDYFFGLPRAEIPTLSDVADLKPGDAVLIRKFGHLGIVQGRWPLMGRIDGWDRQEWPTPVFVRYEELTGRSFRVFLRRQRSEPDTPRGASTSGRIRAGAQGRPNGRGLRRGGPVAAPGLTGNWQMPPLG
jgi:Immunity protein 26